MSSDKARNQPPRPKRKQKPCHTKRRLLVDAEGWTHVVDRPRTHGYGNSEDSTSSPLPQSADMTVDEISREHQHHRRQWEHSESCTKLKVRIAGAMADAQNPVTRNNKHSRDSGVMAISSIVCLGLGSLQSMSSQLRQTSHTQLAALETIGSALGLTPLFAVIQDPHFTALDKEFLGSMGHTITDDPGAFAHIDEGSLVFAIHCPSSLYARISEGVWPAIVVCNDIQKILFNEPQYQDVLEPLVQRCEEIAFPQHRTYFNDTVIYWRQGRRHLERQEDLAFVEEMEL